MSTSSESNLSNHWDGIDDVRCSNNRHRSRGTGNWGRSSKFGKSRENVAESNSTNKESKSSGNNPPDHPVVEPIHGGVSVKSSGNTSPSGVLDTSTQLGESSSTGFMIIRGSEAHVPGEYHNDEHAKKDEKISSKNHVLGSSGTTSHGDNHNDDDAEHSKDTSSPNHSFQGSPKAYHTVHQGGGGSIELEVLKSCTSGRTFKLDSVSSVKVHWEVRSGIVSLESSSPSFLEVVVIIVTCYEFSHGHGISKSRESVIGSERSTTSMVFRNEREEVVGDGGTSRESMSVHVNTWSTLFNPKIDEITGGSSSKTSSTESRPFFGSITSNTGWLFSPNCFSGSVTVSKSSRDLKSSISSGTSSWSEKHSRNWAKSKFGSECLLGSTPIGGVNVTVTSSTGNSIVRVTRSGTASSSGHSSSRHSEHTEFGSFPEISEESFLSTVTDITGGRTGTSEEVTTSAVSGNRSWPSVKFFMVGASKSGGACTGLGNLLESLDSGHSSVHVVVLI